jgi:dTDP-4-dehydrorhamnose 3,5-epimerase
LNLQQKIFLVFCLKDDIVYFMENTEKTLGVQFVSLFPHVDDRGFLVQIIDKSWMRCHGLVNLEIGNVYYTSVKEGIVKAWHYHNEQTDRITCIKGRIKLGWAAEINGKLEENQLVIDAKLNPVLVIIPPKVYHGFTSLEGESIILNAPDKEYDPNDEIRSEWDSLGKEFWSIKNR